MLDANMIYFALIGFLAQSVDGSVGMGYGVISNSFLLGFGLPPAVSSACVHLAEIFTTCASGIFHFKLGNVDKSIFKSLVLPGVLGGVIGAYLLAEVPGEKIAPLVSLYLILVGLLIISRTIKNIEKSEPKVKVAPLGFIGGFCDAVGGGGWGPIVTSTLVADGRHPRFTIGSVNVTEFFVAFAQSITFLLTVKALPWEIIVSLIIGGVLAAPLAAYMCRHLPTKKLMLLVGIVVTGLSIRTLAKLL